MAADPKDLRLPPDGSAAADHPSAFAPRKVKLRCSYGGKILPRPSDSALRYAGGDTRIITVRRESPFPEFLRKMADAYGGPTLIRYQFPGEDLDNLISVSTSEDLENMMEEYDKLALACPDGSTSKLRVFLFPLSDLSANSSSSSSDLHDIGLSYIEAVNGLDGGMWRKDSIASLSSTQTEAVADGHIEENPKIPPPPSLIRPIRPPATSSSPDPPSPRRRRPPRPRISPEIAQIQADLRSNDALVLSGVRSDLGVPHLRQPRSPAPQVLPTTIPPESSSSARATVRSQLLCRATVRISVPPPCHRRRLLLCLDS